MHLNLPRSDAQGTGRVSDLRPSPCPALEVIAHTELAVAAASQHQDPRRLSSQHIASNIMTRIGIQGCRQLQFEAEPAIPQFTTSISVTETDIDFADHDKPY